MPIRRSLPFAALTVSLVLLGACASRDADESRNDPQKGPIVLQEHRAFYVGGAARHLTSPGMEPYEIRVGQAWVEAFIPQHTRKNALPIIMTHATESGVIWLTTPDGREGWADFFVRRGFPVYIVDPPGTGRASFPADQIERVRRGLAPPSSLPKPDQRGSWSWEDNNLGPKPYEHGKQDPTCIGNDSRSEPKLTCYGWRMPNDPKSIEQWLSYRSIPHMPVPGEGQEAFLELLKTTGPAIWLGWSQGGALGGTLVNEHPEMFAGLIGIEPAAECLYRRDAPLDNIKRVPALSIHGINQIGRAGTPSCRKKYAVNAAGGDVTWQSLYDLGIYGNGHMMFWEENNQDIANVLLKWIEAHVETKAVAAK
jgi:pimeloyl-ACP methyl ester carboxylesterase